MGNPRPIAVLWMDDRVEVYDNAETSLSNGVLHIHQRTGIGSMILAEHHLPICNIRDYYPADQENG
jgi:hypothetical protein